MTSYCKQCNESIGFKLICNKCGYSFQEAPHCPYLRRMYIRDGIWEWSGTSCCLVGNYDYHHSRESTEDNRNNKCNTPEYNRDCKIREEWGEWWGL